MCARRFLILIFILILIGVGGAFALYQWGSEVLVRTATPRGHYREPPRDSEPDYARRENWIARPDIKDNPALWLPQGAPDTPAGVPRTATFYVHPTTYLERDRWNAPLDAGGEAGSRARLFVQSQASVFNAYSEVWAPRYRQAAYGAFLLNSEDAHKALDLAYRDVRSAFDSFFAAQPDGKGIILAGHSQGSLHLLRLIADRKDALRGRLVAAYIVGWPVSVKADLPAAAMPACATDEQSGCVLSWQSFKDPANPRLVTKAWVGTTGLTGGIRRREDMLCTNPLAGTNDGAANPTAFAGTLVPRGDFSTATIEKRAIGARCDDGFLIVDGDIPALGPYVLPGNNYHVYDYALFWGAIRGDAIKRSFAAVAARP